MDGRLFLKSTAIAAYALTQSANAQSQSALAVNKQLDGLRQAYGFPTIAADAIRAAFDALKQAVANQSK